MSLSPKDRYASCAALASDIEHWLADELVSAYREPWPARARRRIRQHRTLATGVSAAAVMGSVGLWIVLATRAAADRRAAEGQRHEAEARTAEAESYERNGLIDSERGHREDALAWLEKLRDTLAKLQLSDRLHRERLARVAVELADLDRETGKLDRALEMYQEAIDAYTNLIQQDPSAVETMHDLAQAYGGRARVHLNSGRFEEPLGDYDRALDLERRAIARDSQEPRYLLHLATLYNDRALVHERRVAFAPMEEDLEHARKAIEELQALPAMKQQALKDKVALGRSLRRAQAILHESRGNLFGRKGKLNKALTEFTTAVDLAEALSSDEPGTLEYEMIAAKGGVHAGYVSLQQGARSQACALLGKALDRLRNMSRRFPRDDEIRYLLAHCLCNHSAASLTSLDDLPAAQRPEALRLIEGHVNEANGILTSMQSQRKDADQIALMRVSNYVGLGMVHYKREEWASALPWFDRGLDHCRSLEKAGQATPDIKLRTVLLQSIRALTYYRLARFSEALADADEVLKKQGDPGGLAAVRAAILAKSGKHREGTAAADKLLAMSKSPAKPEFLFDIACVFAIALEGLAKDKALSDKQKAEAAHLYAVRSVDLLRRAIKAGYPKLDKIRQPGPVGDRDLDPLRGRDEFKRFLGELPAAQ